MHVLHATSCELDEYVPGAQGVQLVAPAAMPTPVMDPGVHVLHADSDDEPVASTNLPAAHSVHAAWALSAEYRPFPHRLHAVAPVPLP